MFITSVTKAQGLNNHQYLRFRQQRLETLARETCEIYIHFILKYHLLHQVNVLAHLLCHVTYVTTFNKCFNLVFKPANSIILNNMSKTIPNMQDIQKQQMFSYILLK